MEVGFRTHSGPVSHLTSVMVEPSMSPQGSDGKALAASQWHNEETVVSLHMEPSKRKLGHWSPHGENVGNTFYFPYP